MAKLTDFLNNADPNLIDMANKSADAYGIPRDIFQSLISVESGWNPNAKANGSSAYGLTQLTKAAAQDMAVDPYSIPDNLAGGAAYLAQQYARFGNWPDALSAYNQGAGKYQQAEGRQYAQKIMNLADSVQPQNAVDKELASLGVEISTGQKPDGSKPADNAIASFVKAQTGNIAFIILGIVILAIAIISTKPAQMVISTATKGVV